MLENKRYLTVKEASEYLSFAPTTLYHWIREGELTYIKKGRSVRFDILELDKFMKKDIIKLEA